MIDPDTTPAERRVIQAIHEGNHSRRDLAAALQISDRTVGEHLTNLYAKYGIDSADYNKLLLLIEHLTGQSSTKNGARPVANICPNCGKAKRFNEFGRHSSGKRRGVCLECHRAIHTKTCKQCEQEKPLGEFSYGGHVLNALCATCASSRPPQERMPPIKNAGDRMGEIITWQHHTPPHLPPVQMSGRIVGTIGGKLVAAVAGSMFVVGI